MTIEEYYNAIAPKLTNYLVGSGSSYAQACDIVQESFLRLWKRRDELMDDMSQVSGLVYTIARNLRKDMARKAAHESLQADITDEDETAPVSVDGNRPGEADEETRLLRRRLNAALKDVPPLLREAFLLFHVSGLSIAEISRQTGAAESLVKVRIFRAKEKLREILKQPVTFS